MLALLPVNFDWHFLLSKFHLSMPPTMFLNLSRPARLGTPLVNLLNLHVPAAAAAAAAAAALTPLANASGKRPWQTPLASALFLMLPYISPCSRVAVADAAFTLLPAARRCSTSASPTQPGPSFPTFNESREMQPSCPTISFQHVSRYHRSIGAQRVIQHVLAASCLCCPRSLRRRYAAVWQHSRRAR